MPTDVQKRVDTSARDRMPSPDNRPIEQLWDVHWSIVVKHLQCRDQQARERK